MDLYCADPAQPLTTAREELDYLLIDLDPSDPSDLDYLYRDLSDLSRVSNL